MVTLAFGACSRRQTEKSRPRSRATSSRPVLRRATQEKLDSYWGAPATRGTPEAPRIIAWEAEATQETDFPENNPFAPADAAQAAKLSGGKWIGVEDPDGSRFLEYEVSVARKARYQLFARKFWKHGPFRWRFDAGQFSYCGKEVLLLDSVAIRRFVGVNWVALGEVELAAGKRRFRVELTAPYRAAAFDRFMLVEGNYVPSGLGDPLPSPSKPPAGWFVVDPGVEHFEPTPIDLRALNRDNRERFERLATVGGRLVRASTGSPERLWGVNIAHDALSLPDPLMRRYARWLAKLGVNFVRLHGPFFLESNIRKLDREKLEGLIRFHEALRSEGIYLGLSIYFPLWMHLQADPEFPGYTGQSPYGLQYFRPSFAGIQSQWWRQILALKSASSDRPLAEDPSIAFVELVNEDSTLFWTMAPYSNIPEPETNELERLFGRFLAEKHGSVDHAMAKWSGAAQRGDEPNAGRVGIMSLWDMAHRRDRRSQDTAEFLARLMRDYYASQVQELREGARYEGLTVCSNWRTADPRYLEPLDKWANAVCDVMDHHEYYQGPHRGDAASYSVNVGDQYDDRSSLRLDSMESNQATSADQIAPGFALRVAGKPNIVSEVGWPWPNRFRAEYAALAVGYGSLVGTDGFAFFASSSPTWAPALEKFTINDFAIMGQFPAAAFAFRQGLVAEGRPNVEISLPERELFGLKGLPLATKTGLDGLRWKDLPIKRLLSRGEADPVDPLSHFVGPIELGFAPEASTRARSMDAWIDRNAGTVSSNTKELLLDYGRGVVTISAPAVQAVAGFLRATGPLALPAAQFALDVEYGSAFLVALDRKPLETSQQILLQIVTETTNTGFSAPGKGLRRVLDTGHGPTLMREILGTIRLNRLDAKSLAVTALDLQGQPVRQSRGGADEIWLLPDSLYYIIEPRVRDAEQLHQTPGGQSPPP